ncbi:MAG: carboxylating nicotinate-nucleotide diphosphorylase [Candidatus Omnitrophica bacterium]|nr:carboxylating nicotinate-nucleotide diphosphorylase [Candidatus Omnitrophota bacterium]
MKLNKARTLRIIKAALKEDIGPGDITTASTVPKLRSVKASIVANEDFLMCGMEIAEWVLNAIDYSVRFKPQVADGELVREGKEVAFIEGPARPILAAERTMLNFICFLSGVATGVRGFVDKVKDYKADIYDTRKTYPLLRYLEKYAVTVGGGKNHRFGLWDQVLVKENHIRTSNISGKKDFLAQIRKQVTKNVKVEIEVENLEEFKSIVVEKPDIIMLDNMSALNAKKAVEIRNSISGKSKKPVLEISGGITLENVESYAKTGAERISLGEITDSVRSVDMSLEIIA